MEFRNLKRIPRPPFGAVLDWKLANNPFTNFEGLTTIPTLQALRLNNTNIKTFKGAVPQPSLQSLDLSGTPLSRYEMHPMMAVIVFGNQLALVNHKKVSRKTTEAASEHRNRLYQLIVTGWILTCVHRDIVVINPETLERRRLFVGERGANIGKRILAWKLAMQRNDPRAASVQKEPEGSEGLETSTAGSPDRSPELVLPGLPEDVSEEEDDQGSTE
jgi:hypothetical protein